MRRAEKEFLDYLYRTLFSKRSTNLLYSLVGGSSLDDEDIVTAGKYFNIRGLQGPVGIKGCCNGCILGFCTGKSNDQDLDSGRRGRSITVW
jgi:hypothetical protein